MTLFRWHVTPVPSDVKIRQVYGFCFDKEGRTLLLQDAKDKFTLPGGTPEKTDQNPTATLRRECDEEGQVELENITFLGWQEVIEDGREPYAQIRFVAVISNWLPSRVDPATGTQYRRYLAPLNKIPALLNWGIDGLLQAASAVSVAEGLNIDIRKSRAENYYD